MKFYFSLIIVFILLKILRKNNLFFFYFILGSVSSFLIMLYFGGDEFEILLKHIISFFMYHLTLYIPRASVLEDYFLINISLKDGSAMSWIIDYECTGIVEMLVFYSLLLFYPIKDIFYKTKYFIMGTIYLITANILRMFVILFSVLKFGENIFYFSHVILARIVFFILVIILYYNVFTKKHVRQQLVGDLYDNK
ncbi:exosortase family protein XrtG [Helicovermis profundi]|uniref:Exosortase family protein XrtG n=1 Tax=Helicovermis profundi TaxID=3065157 RepID=A0AAU9EMW3_9FIRM|nr:exosortase family protein XrtG [Clostridia bacterium S502]